MTGKLSIEQNTVLLRDIKKRSDAANVLSKFSGAHKEVFELCAEYLTLIEVELGRMNPGSPRLEPFIKGRSRAGEAHRFHMLRWAEIEATQLTIEAQEDPDSDRSRETANRALEIVEQALTAYPSERALTESRGIIKELIVSIEVSALVRLAEQCAVRGDHSAARRAYREALFFLGRENVQTDERQLAAKRIKFELERLELTEIQSPVNK